MNIFYLHPDPATAARLHCDQHVLKMIIESAQLLASAHIVLDGEEVARTRVPNLPKLTHQNHPSAIWARYSGETYTWLHRLLKALMDEYYLRYKPDRRHRYDENGLVRNLEILPKAIAFKGFHAPPQVMPREFRSRSTVESYRKYYHSKTFAKWRTEVPRWWNGSL